MADVSIDDKSLFKVFISLVSDSISIIIPASLTLYSSSFSISNLIVLIVLTSSLAALILVQEQRVADDFDNGCEYLFPRKDGSPLKQDTFRVKLNELAYEEKITDNKGEIFRFHAHAFRHTVGTRMINNGVPQHIVQKFLGHESPEMTARYAHIFDETLKKEFTKFKETLVTNNGSILELSEDDSEADNTDFQWFKKNINAQALPNGYYRLPVIAGPCPHANACLTCTNFCTSKNELIPKSCTLL